MVFRDDMRKVLYPSEVRLPLILKKHVMLLFHLVLKYRISKVAACSQVVISAFTCITENSFP